MFNVGDRTFKTYIDFYTYVMTRYFRRVPPIPTNIYLEVMEDVETRLKVIEHCQFPAIINSLANDENDAVRRAARDHEFWELLGRHQDILGFARSERIRFAQIEGYVNIIVLLMFEDDLEVLEQVIQNPSISVKMLALFIHLLKERGRGRKDEQTLEMARRVISSKRERILKVSTIQKAVQKIQNEESKIACIEFLYDDDVEIRKMVRAEMQSIEPNQLARFIRYVLKSHPFRKYINQFRVVSELLQLIRVRSDLHHTRTDYLDPEILGPAMNPKQTIADFMSQHLHERRYQLLEKSGEDLTNFDNILLLSTCHVEKDSTLKIRAAEILSLEEILNLVNDPSTPRRIFKQVLAILEHHPKKEIVEEVNQVLLRESRRMQESLNELEVSVQAYFDIIFQSLGYHQINSYRDVVKAIQTTERQLEKFGELVANTLMDDKQKLDSLFGKLKENLNNRADEIYFDVSDKTIHELQYIRSLLDEINNLKEMSLGNMRPGTPEDLESSIRTKAQVIWQSAISAYLGRIKDLVEMVCRKLAKIAGDQAAVETEISETTKDLESDYKKRVSCNLSIQCSACVKRGCAAERFLEEARFYLHELFDNFIEAEEEPAEIAAQN